MKLPRNLKKPAVNEVKDRLRPCPKNYADAQGPDAQGARMPRGPKMR